MSLFQALDGPCRALEVAQADARHHGVPVSVRETSLVTHRYQQTRAACKEAHGQRPVPKQTCSHTRPLALSPAKPHKHLVAYTIQYVSKCMPPACLDNGAQPCRTAGPRALPALAVAARQRAPAQVFPACLYTHCSCSASAAQVRARSCASEAACRPGVPGAGQRRQARRRSLASFTGPSPRMIATPTSTAKRSPCPLIISCTTYMCILSDP